MPRPNIITLRQFYSSPLGRKVKQRLRGITVSLWPDLAEHVVVGVGYALPILRVLEREKPRALLALMPAEQGAMYWPVHLDNRSVLGEVLAPPLAVSSIDRIVMLHVLEHEAEPLQLLQIYWQLLVPGGRMLLVVPNCRGIWAHFGRHPYGRGKAYSITQLRELLNEAQFAIREAHTALFAPPSSHPFNLKIWGLLESIGRLILPHFGGVVVVEVEKQIYAAIAQPVTAPRRAWAGSPQAAPSAAKIY